MFEPSHQSLPHHLKSQLRSRKGRISERCLPGSPAFLPAYSSDFSQLHTQFDDNNTPRVGYCFDGSFLPIRNGCSYTLLNLMNAAGRSKEVRPYLILCDRGLDKTEQYYNQHFSTIFIFPEDYYGDTGVLEKVFRDQNIDIAQCYSSEGMINLAPRLKSIGLKTIFEVQNTDHDLLAQLGAPVGEVEQALKKQELAQELSDLIFVRSSDDARKAIELGASQDKVYRYNGGIEVDDFEFHIRQQNSNRLVFLGHMFYEPNQRAVDNIITEILPSLRTQYTLTIIGVGPDDLKEHYESLGIELKSNVDNLSKELLNYNIALAPITEGSGTRLKILDYLASGIPTITTSVGIDGLNSEILNSVIVEDDMSKYGGIIDDIGTHPEKYTSMTVNGRRFVEQYYSWKTSVAIFIQAYKELYNTKEVKES